jgi:hypothetical protein
LAADDPAGELRRLVGLGAAVVATQPPPVNLTVLLDPEGNEFCLLGGGVADQSMAT